MKDLKAKRLKCPICKEKMVPTTIEHDDGSGWMFGYSCGCNWDLRDEYFGHKLPDKKYRKNQRIKKRKEKFFNLFPFFKKRKSRFAVKKIVSNNHEIKFIY